MHGLFICNTAFQHSARHKTTWQGQRRDVTTGQVVPIYNVIDFVICPQTHKRLLTDSRSYSGTLLRRDKLLDILQTFLGESEMRIIRLLLADTSLELRLSTGECHAFATSIGTPQGDSLSPVLFTIYLEAALRDLRSRLPTRPQTDANLPLDVEYADDTDFISTSRLFLDDIERIAPGCLAEWSLTINTPKRSGRVFAGMPTGSTKSGA